MGNDYQFIPTNNFKERQVGRTCQLYAFPRGFAVKIGALNAKHAASVQGLEYSSSEVQTEFNTGYDRFLANVATNPAEGDTLTVMLDDLQYDFIFSATPGAGVIEIGVDAAATETNMIAAINALDDIACVSATSKAQTTGPSDARKLVIETSVPSKVVIEANTGGKSKWIQKFSGQRFIQDTQNQYVFSLEVDGEPDWVFVNALTPANGNKTNTAARCRALIVNAHAGTTPTAGTGYVYSLNRKSRAQIATAMVAAFGADASVAFVLSGTNNEILTINWGTAGSIGKVQYIRFGIFSQTPKNKIKLGANDQPYLPGFGPGIPIGSSKDFKRTDSAKTVTVEQDSARNDFGTAQSGTGSSLSFTSNQPNNAFIQRMFSGNAAVAVDGQYDYVMPGGGDLEVWGIVAVNDGSVSGQKNVEVIPEVLFTGGLKKELTKAFAGLPADGQIISNGYADGAGYTGLFRQVDQQ